MLVLKLTFMLKVFLWTWAEDRERKVGSGGAQGIQDFVWQENDLISIPDLKSSQQREANVRILPWPHRWQDTWFINSTQIGQHFHPLKIMPIF